MSKFGNYIKGYFSGLDSLLVGMRTSLKVYFRKGVTEQYPEKPPHHFAYSRTTPCHTGYAS